MTPPRFSELTFHTREAFGTTNRHPVLIRNISVRPGVHPEIYLGQSPSSASILCAGFFNWRAIAGLGIELANQRAPALHSSPLDERGVNNSSTTRGNEPLPGPHVRRYLHLETKVTYEYFPRLRSQRPAIQYPMDSHTGGRPSSAGIGVFLRASCVRPDVRPSSQAGRAPPLPSRI